MRRPGAIGGHRLLTIRAANWPIESGAHCSGITVKSLPYQFLTCRRPPPPVCSPTETNRRNAAIVHATRRRSKQHVTGTVPWVAAQRRVVQRVEAVIVGQRDVGAVVQQQRQHIVALLRNGVVQRRVAFRILKKSRRRNDGEFAMSTEPPIPLGIGMPRLFNSAFIFTFRSSFNKQTHTHTHKSSLDDRIGTVAGQNFATGHRTRNVARYRGGSVARTACLLPKGNNIQVSADASSS